MVIPNFIAASEWKVANWRYDDSKASGGDSFQLARPQTPYGLLTKVSGLARSRFPQPVAVVPPRGSPVS